MPVILKRVNLGRGLIFCSFIIQATLYSDATMLGPQQASRCQYVSTLFPFCILLLLEITYLQFLPIRFWLWTWVCAEIYIRQLHFSILWHALYSCCFHKTFSDILMRNFWGMKSQPSTWGQCSGFMSHFTRGKVFILAILSFQQKRWVSKTCSEFLNSQ